MSDAPKSDKAAKLAWVEPAVIDLKVEETHMINGVGGDGNIHVDCSRS